MRDPELPIAGWLLLESAQTLRERTFARTVSVLKHDSISFVHSPETFQIHPMDATAAGLLYASSANTWARDALSMIPITRPARSSLGDPELVPMLQDLADILADEATAAFNDDYYPGIPDVDVPQDHVDVVMRALQREMDREGKSRQRVPARYEELPRERQRALAERRRWWFGRYSITPERWRTGQWVLWDVTDDPMPELQARTRAVLV
jgi:ribosomal protein S21